MTMETTAAEPPAKRPRLTVIDKPDFVTMQTAALLQEIKLSEAKKEKINSFIVWFKEYVQKIKPITHQLSEQSWLDELGVHIPLVQKPVEVKGTFHFAAPLDVRVIGSFGLDLSTKPVTVIDLALILPRECVQDKDQLNERYLRKRALYLSCMAAHLQKSKNISTLHFTFQQNSRKKPVLLVTPLTEKFGRGYQVCLHVSAEKSTFRLRQFLPDKNNVRSRWFYQNTALVEDSSIQEPPTPHYNSLILADLLALHHLAFIKEALGGVSAAREALLLLRVWAMLRKVDEAGLSNFLLAMFVSYLINTGEITCHMTSHQIVTALLSFLAKPDWAEDGLSCRIVDAEESLPSLSDFHQAFDTVFVDNSGYLNLCAHITSADSAFIRHSAKMSLEQREIAGLDAFEALFVLRVEFMNQFDLYIQISNLSTLKSRLKEKPEYVDHGGDLRVLSVSPIVSLLQRAIGRRVKLISLKPQSALKWSVSEKCPAQSCDPLTFGLVLDPDHSNTVIDRGPSADQPEAEEFRDFWGEKCDLRRFQDGGICEAVVWPCATLAARRSVVGRIVKHVLLRHLSIPRNAVHVIGSQLDLLLQIAPLPGFRAAYGTGEEQHANVGAAYDSLAKMLRGLQGLPLALHTIQGISPAFRHTETFPPLPAHFGNIGVTQGERKVLSADSNIPPWVPHLKVLCLLESSGKWPDDKDAILRVKAAFHAQLGLLLRQHHSLVTRVDPNHLDVLVDGFVMRVEVGYLKEISRLRMSQAADGLIKMIDTPAALALERDLVLLPKMSSALLGLHQSHCTFGPAVSLVKRWLSSQLLLLQISEEAAELIVAYLYLHPAPYSPPGSPLVAFKRFLHLISTHDWMVAPLLVNLNNDFTDSEYAEISREFGKRRSTLPLMFISTPYDKFGSVWTKGRVTKAILSLLTALSKQALQVLSEQLTNHGVHDYKLIFRPPLDVFDAVIELKADRLVRPWQSVDVPDGAILPKIRKRPEMKELPVYGFDPALHYLQDLEESLGNFATFFYDIYGGACIALHWKDDAFKSRPVKVSHLSGPMKLEEEGGQPVLKLDKTVVMETIEILGAGLVAGIRGKLV